MLLSYKIYFSPNKTLVEEYDNSVLFDTLTTSEPLILNYLENGTTYYWAVIPHDGKENGLCLNKFWYFRTREKCLLTLR